YASSSITEGAELVRNAADENGRPEFHSKSSADIPCAKLRRAVASVLVTAKYLTKKELTRITVGSTTVALTPNFSRWIQPRLPIDRLRANDHDEPRSGYLSIGSAMVVRRISTQK